jgi:hypothetical protein
MTFLTDSQRPNSLTTLDSVILGSASDCFYCGKTIGFYRPVIIFGLKTAEVVGAAHPECGYFDFRYAQFSLSENIVLSREETSWLAHFYQKLVKLPGQGHPEAILRRCLAALLLDYPAELTRIPALLNRFGDENRVELTNYPGDLEWDLYRFLGKVTHAAESEPLNVRIDFG